MNKIVFVIEQLAGGGAERVTAALANYFCKKKDYEVYLVVYSHSLEMDYPTEGNVHWMVPPELKCSRSKAVISRFRFLRQSILSICPDCVISLGTPRITVLLTAALLGKKIPLILSERNDPSRFPVNRRWRMLRTISYYFADRIVFQTTQARDYFPSKIRKKGTVICNPITGNLPERYSGIREKRIVNFCRLSPQKNLPLLIDAFFDISADFPTYTLCIYGEGAERSSLEEKIKSLGLEGRVLLPGHSYNIYEDIRKAALFVSSSDYEGISNSMLEAIALGLPTICTDCPAGGARETIRNGKNGVLVPVADRYALAAAITKLLSDDNLAESLSKEGSNLRNTLNISSVARQWEDVINQLTD